MLNLVFLCFLVVKITMYFNFCALASALAWCVCVVSCAGALQLNWIVCVEFSDEEFEWSGVEWKKTSKA